MQKKADRCCNFGRPDLVPAVLLAWLGAPCGALCVSGRTAQCPTLIATSAELDLAPCA